MFGTCAVGLRHVRATAFGAARGCSAGGRQRPGERFFPKDLLAKDAEWAATHRGRSSKGVAFTSADLDGTGRQEYLVAVYRAGGDTALRVLRKEGGLVAVADAPATRRFIMGGVSLPEVSTIDLDHSGRLGVLIDFRQGHGETTRCLLKWDGNSLQTFGTWSTENDYYGDPVSYSLLNYADFVDLDGDGSLEIVNEPEFEPGRPGDAPETAKKYEIYKIQGDGYRLSSTFFEAFFQIWSNPYGTYQDTFITSQPGTPYIVTIADGDGRGIPPVTSAEIELNGQVIAGPGKVSTSSRYLTIPVSVQAKNVIKVTLTGPKDSELFIGVGPAPSSNPQPAQAGKPQQ